MPLILSGNVASALDTGYTVANSARWGGTDNEYMSKTLGTPSNTKKMTWSFWTKKTRNENDGHLATVYADGSNYNTINFTDANKFQVFQYISASIQLNLITEQKFVDNSAWSHFVIQMDTTQSTASNRCKVWHNGSQITDWATETYWAQNTAIKLNEASATLTLNAITTSSQYHGYVAEFIMCDGQTYQASDFGEYNSSSPTIWQPKDPSGLTFGTNGFWLDFEASGNLGNDANGGTDFSETNFAATDQSTDTCTLNYPTFNPLDNTYGQGTFSEGNLKIVTDSSLYAVNTSTFHLTKGKWHFEVRVGDSNQKNCIGISGNSGTFSGDSTLAFGDSANEYSYTATGELRHSGDSTGSWGSSFTDGDIIGCSFDLDNNEIFFYKNGTIQNSGSAFSITDPTSTSSGGYFVAGGDFASDNTSTMEYNFGSPTYSISSGAADANGYGNFEHAPKSGHYAINSANLAEFG